MGTSNLQELKDAAVELMRFTCNSCEQRFCEEDVEEEDGQRAPSPCSAIIRMRNALSANPIRNCDVGTAEEQGDRFAKFCDTYDCCTPCPVKKLWNFKNGHKPSCGVIWAQMLYKAEGAE